MLSRSSIMVLCFGWDLFPRVKLNLHEDLHTHEHTPHANYFKDTLSVSPLGYEKCFVSKGYHNVQTYLPFLVWNKTNSSWILRYSLHVGFRFGKFLGPFPGTCTTWTRQSLILRHFQRLITGKLTGVDPGRPQSLQTKKGRSNKLTEIIQ